MNLQRRKKYLVEERIMIQRLKFSKPSKRPQVGAVQYFFNTNFIASFMG